MLNELNKLQTYKLITSEFTLILYALIMEGFGVKYWTQSTPTLVRQDVQSPVNYVLHFCITVLLIYIIGVG